MAKDSKSNIQGTLQNLRSTLGKQTKGSRDKLSKARADITGANQRISEIGNLLSSNVTTGTEKYGPSMDLSNPGFQQNPAWQEIMAQNRALDAERTDLRNKQLPALQKSLKDIQGEVGDEVDRSSDLLRGAEFGASVLGDGLGRLSEDKDISDALARRKQMSETGLSSAESVAQREKAIGGIDQATQTGLRGLSARLAASGVKGATAGQQLIQRDLAGSQQKAEVERDLFLSGEQTKREAFDKYTSSLGDIKTFDLAQQSAEKDILLSSGMGFAQLGSSERSAIKQAEIAKSAQIAAARAGRSGGCFAKGTKVEMRDGSFKNIEDLNPGDELLADTTITGTSKHRATEQMYNFNGTLVSATHFVSNNGIWLKVEDTEAPKVEYNNKYVYNIFTNTGIISINYSLFSDYDGFPDHDEIDTITLRRMNEFVQTIPVREIR